MSKNTLPTTFEAQTINFAGPVATPRLLPGRLPSAIGDAVDTSHRQDSPERETTSFESVEFAIFEQEIYLLKSALSGR
jgi:hypothetical protein